MNELYWIGGFVIIWLLLQLVILPKLGFDTCLRGACNVEFDAKKKRLQKENQKADSKSQK